MPSIVLADVLAAKAFIACYQGQREEALQILDRMQKRAPYSEHFTRVKHWIEDVRQSRRPR